MASRRSTRQDAEQGVRFSRTLFIALLVISGALIAFDRPASRSAPFASFRAGFTDVSAPLLDLVAQPLRGIKNIGPYWRRQGELVEENAQLRQQLIEARYWEDLAYRQRDRIEVYEDALDVESAAIEDRIGAWTVADPRGPFVRARLIGRGSDAGIQDGYPVINLYGLVGRVYETGRRSARVLLLTDLNSRVPVMADRSNARAILVGDNSEFPRLDYVGRAPDIQAGDRIVSSGDDGILPRGLPVGEAVATREGGWRVRLYSDQAPVDFVWVWPYERVTPPDQEIEPVTPTQFPPTAVDAGANQDPDEDADEEAGEEVDRAPASGGDGNATEEAL
ncbi:rod shape-determining protein MreC [Maricaulis maris]|uniref:Cell shape-determining protein MreC n=1 Tax=Maricaulis maris TaxID=74318 RepID=A0A495DE99_9PROT|nr:rod shape-determining protein MreC [Maricaulis maris]RKR00225.1 rod shape-determining protein MreC [Maricaulis maris]